MNQRIGVLGAGAAQFFARTGHAAISGAYEPAALGGPRSGGLLQQVGGPLASVDVRVADA
ncbi:MAG TPA: hypothetical protein VGG75_26690 [Trebonia sp.]|jgi:hypothetical protein